MKDELKKYINENLKEKTSSKNKKSYPHVPLFSLGKIKYLLVEDDAADDDEIYNNDIENNDEPKQILSIEDDVVPFLREKGIVLDKDDNNLNEYIKESDKYNDFQTTLFKLIDDRNLIDADVYNKVHIDRRLFSKIRSDKTYHPSKETIILLGLSLELSEDEIEELLNSASYSLPRNNYYDLIIRFCFMKGIYKIKEVNDLLDEYNCKLFNY